MTTRTGFTRLGESTLWTGYVAWLGTRPAGTFDVVTSPSCSGTPVREPCPAHALPTRWTLAAADGAGHIDYGRGGQRPGRGAVHRSLIPPLCRYPSLDGGAAVGKHDETIQGLTQLGQAAVPEVPLDCSERKARVAEASGGSGVSSLAQGDDRGGRGPWLAGPIRPPYRLQELALWLAPQGTAEVVALHWRDTAIGYLVQS